MQKKLYKLRFQLNEVIVFGLFVWLVVACGESPHHYRPRIPANLTYLAKLMLDSSDVPSHWQDDGEFFIEHVPGADALLHGFNGTNDPNRWDISLKQQLSAYPDPEAAEQAYLSDVNLFDKYPDFWQDMSGLSYQSKADKYRFACNNEQSDSILLSCTLIQLYGRLHSKIYVKIDGTHITLDQVEKVLERVDEKLISFSEKNEATEVPKPEAGGSTGFQ